MRMRMKMRMTIEEWDSRVKVAFDSLEGTAEEGAALDVPTMTIGLRFAELALKWSPLGSRRSTPHSPTTFVPCFARYPLAVQSTLSVLSDGALPNHLTVKDSRRCRWSGAMIW